MQYCPPAGGHRGGSTMVIVLGVLSMLAVIVSTFVTIQRSGFQATAARAYAVRTDILATGVLNHVRTLLAKDMEIDQEPFDHPRYDPWLATILTDNQAVFDPATGRGATYRYVTRLDMGDTGWQGGNGQINGGRPPENVNMASQVVREGKTVWAHGPTKGVFTDRLRTGVPDYLTTSPGNPTNWYYVDADGDGKADSPLMPIGTGVTFPDGSCAYVAVRIVDNAHLNPTQHSQWSPFYSTQGDPWPNHVQDTTTGRVDWTFLPDTFAPPTQPRAVPRPRLPEVSFQNLRNMAAVWFGPVYGFLDNPDSNETTYTAGTGWAWNDRPDPLTLSSRYYFSYLPGVDFSKATIPWAGTANTGPWGTIPTNARNDRIDAGRPNITIEDDLALRMWNTDPRSNKYAQIYRLPFGTANLATPGSGDPDAFYERNFARVVSSVTRERCKKWMKNPDNPNGPPIYATPFDLRRLLNGDGTDYDANGNASPLLMSKLNELLKYMRAYNVLGRPNIAPNGTFPTGAAAAAAIEERRAQYLANLCEYARGPSAAGAYRTTAYAGFNGVGRTIYGLCRQPFLSEVIRDGGLRPPNLIGAVGALVGGLLKGEGRTGAMWDSVNVGVEIHNPYNTAIDLTNYRLEFKSVGLAGINILGGDETVDLSSLRRIAPFGYAWIATDVKTTVPGTTAPGSTARLAVASLPGGLAKVNAMRRIGPRVVIELRSRATDNGDVLMDICDTRIRSLGDVLTAGNVLNLGFQPSTGYSLGGPATITRGVDFSDWDGTDADLVGSTTASVRAFVNAGFLNLLDDPISWMSYRTGIYRPQSSAVRPEDHYGGETYYSSVPAPATPWHPPSAVSTGLWMAYIQDDAQSTLNLALDAVTWTLGAAFPNFPRFTGGRKNAVQDLLVKTTTPALTFWNNFVYGSTPILPNRGVDRDAAGGRNLAGTQLYNLGELTLITTVGNGPNNCYTQVSAASSDFIRGTLGVIPGVVNNVLRALVAPVLRPSGFPGDYLNYPGIINQWCWVNFDRLLKFDIYEGAAAGLGMGPNGMPSCDNARILDFVSLYLGNGPAGGTLNDFAPYPRPGGATSDAVAGGPADVGGGSTLDSGEDYLAGLNANGTLDLVPNVRPRYREGRINMNTAPWMVVRCLPFPREARTDVAQSAKYYADGCTAGFNVWFAESLCGTDMTLLAGQQGYLNQVLATNPLFAGINKDPYFRDVSDIYMFAQGANSNLAGRFYNNAGLGWDGLMHSSCGGWIYSIGAFGATAASPWKHPEYKRLPHVAGYQFPLNKKLPWPFTGDPFGFPGGSQGEILESPDRGFAADMSQRDSVWAATSNVVSTRSDVYTVYILVKLMRPTPGTVHASTGGEYEDLGETRLVAIVDRTNVVIDPATGRASLHCLPRVLGKALSEAQ